MKYTIILAALLWTLTPQMVANRCAGEFSAAVVECSCAGEMWALWMGLVNNPGERAA